MDYTFDSNSHWIQQQQQDFIPPVGISFSPQPGMINEAELQNVSKADCELMENQFFNEFSSGIKQESHLNEYAWQSNSSDNSSPDALLSIPLSAQEVDSMNAKIQHDLNGDEKLTEEELASKRKAQNRAAQRAFRERKEMKLKELKEQLNQSETDKAELQRQLDELKKQNIVISTENKLLLENNSIPSNPVSHAVPAASTNGNFTFPEKTSEDIASQKRYFITPNQLSDPGIPYESKRLTIPEVWDYLSALNETHDFEIDEIMSEIKGLEVCHERGPAYPLVLVDQIVQQHVLRA